MKLLASRAGTVIEAYRNIPYKQEGSYSQRAKQVANRILCDVKTQFDKRTSTLYVTKLSGPLVPETDFSDQLVLMIQKEVRARKPVDPHKHIVAQIFSQLDKSPAERTIDRLEPEKPVEFDQAKDLDPFDPLVVKFKNQPIVHEESLMHLNTILAGQKALVKMHWLLETQLLTRLKIMGLSTRQDNLVIDDLGDGERQIYKSHEAV